MEAVSAGNIFELTKRAMERSERIMAEVWDIERIEKLPTQQREDAILSRIPKDKADAVRHAVASMPTEMRLSPCVYTMAEPDGRRAVADEFRVGAEPSFYQYLAEHRPAELLGKGLCHDAIESMRLGFPPADSEGNIYGVGVDHKIERAGSGEAVKRRINDPDMGIEVYTLNAVPNLLLLRNEFHDLKNVIVSSQIQNMEPGDQRIIWQPVPSGEHSLILLGNDVSGHPKVELLEDFPEDASMFNYVVIQAYHLKNVLERAVNGVSQTFRENAADVTARPGASPDPDAVMRQGLSIALGCGRQIAEYLDMRDEVRDRLDGDGKMKKEEKRQYRHTKALLRDIFKDAHVMEKVRAECNDEEYGVFTGLADRMELEASPTPA